MMKKQSFSILEDLSCFLGFRGNRKRGDHGDSTRLINHT